MKGTRKLKKSDLIRIASNPNIKMQTRETALSRAIDNYSINLNYVANILSDKQLVKQVVNIYEKLLQNEQNKSKKPEAFRRSKNKIKR